jgi:hypothetical protein
MPADLDIRDIGLSHGKETVGANGAIAREIIRETYHCQLRAEEDFFLPLDRILNRGDPRD